MKRALRYFSFALLAILAGCRGSGAPWRSVDAVLQSGASLKITVKITWVGGVDADVHVETEDSPESKATLLFDRGLPTERTATP